MFPSFITQNVLQTCISFLSPYRGSTVSIPQLYVLYRGSTVSIPQLYNYIYYTEDPLYGYHNYTTICTIQRIHCMDTTTIQLYILYRGSTGGDSLVGVNDALLFFMIILEESLFFLTICQKGMFFSLGILGIL